MDSKFKINLEKLIPGIIFGALLLDIGMRNFPVGLLSFSAGEALTAKTKPGIPFVPNALFWTENSYGDLAALGNLPKEREIKVECFSTDEWGFRRNSLAQDRIKPTQIILVGNSYSVGSGISDEQTLAAQIERASKRGVFNGAGVEVELKHILWLAKKLQIQSGTVIYQYLERHPIPLEEALITFPLEDGSPNTAEKEEMTNESKSSPVEPELTPLQILCQIVFKKFQNDCIFPNPYKHNVIVRKFSNGRKILFYPRDLENFSQERLIDIKGWSRLYEELKHKNFRIVFVLVPDKFTVYHPLLQDPPPKALPSGYYLNKLEIECRNAGLPVINLLKPLQDHAAESYKNGKYIYFLDDTHWNAAGIEFAAEIIWKEMKKLKIASAHSSAF